MGSNVITQIYEMNSFTLENHVNTTSYKISRKLLNDFREHFSYNNTSIYPNSITIINYIYPNSVTEKQLINPNSVTKY
ncbi:hypothetical protein SAMN04488023_1175 [Pedobacter rhizosphaerae]|uniref:Uncharacterized protein n=1 Tax=Pedobacter rhizosphaerae TaxID=390241 RepID=A0A1H9S7Q9_9SPHI|nr:hypothetical protein SAMN04488023_1175 [Pedobacter rhizosphaerae]